jgi:hypothetical protein
VSRLASLELDRYGRRAAAMGVAASAALGLDLATKAVAVSLDPRTLVFNDAHRSFAGLENGLIAVVAACSLLACVLPARIVAIGAGAALGGAVGNLASRGWWESSGGTPDFIRFVDGSTGNVADLMIISGGLAMALGALLWFGLTAAAGRDRPL